MNRHIDGYYGFSFSKYIPGSHKYCCNTQLDYMLNLS